MKEFLQDIARRAGEITLEYRCKLSSISVDRKSEKDLVTEADVAVEKFLIREINSRYPDHAVFGEETGEHAGNDYRWIIDPIDGTASFVHGQPFYSISIAVSHDDIPVLATVEAPVLKQSFFAEKGGGAFCNGEKISVSRREKLIECIVGTGFACLRSNLKDNNLPYFNDIVPKVRGVRRYGSAAIDLCYVASGLLDAFWEMNLHEMDIAAGNLIVEEAGGCATDFSGGQDGMPQEILASNSLIHDSMIARFASIRQRAE